MRLPDNKLMSNPELHIPPGSQQRIDALEAALESCRRLVTALERDLACERLTAGRGAAAAAGHPSARALAAACGHGLAAEVALLVWAQPPQASALAAPSPAKDTHDDAADGVAPAILAALAAACETPPAEAEVSVPPPEAPVAGVEAAVPLTDDFTLIRGIDPGAALVLWSVGLTGFADIAAFKADDVATLGRLIGDPRRIAKEGWIEQAALLAAGTLTSFARDRLEEDSRRPALVAVSAEKSLAARLEAIEAIADLRIAAGTPAPDAEPTPDATPLAVAPAGTADVVPFEPARHPAKKRLRAAHWMTAAASIVLLAAASITSAGLRPAVAGYIGAIGCTSSLTVLAPACGQLTWLVE